jgi:hypothetical protein
MVEGKEANDQLNQILVILRDWEEGPDSEENEEYLGRVLAKWDQVIEEVEGEDLRRCLALFWEEAAKVVRSECVGTALRDQRASLNGLAADREASEPGWAQRYVEDFLATGVFNRSSFVRDLELTAGRSEIREYR